MSSPGRGAAAPAAQPNSAWELLTLLEEEAFKNAKPPVRQQTPQMLHSSSSGPGCVFAKPRGLHQPCKFSQQLCARSEPTVLHTGCFNSFLDSTEMLLSGPCVTYGRVGVGWLEATW